MDKDQASKCLTKLGELFPLAELTAAQQRNYLEEFTKHEYDATIAAMERHHLNSTFTQPKPGELLEALREDARKRKISEDHRRRQQERSDYDLLQKNIAGLMATLEPGEMRELMDEWRDEFTKLRTKDPDPDSNHSFRSFCYERRVLKA